MPFRLYALDEMKNILDAIGTAKRRWACYAPFPAEMESSLVPCLLRLIQDSPNYDISRDGKLSLLATPRTGFPGITYGVVGHVDNSAVNKLQKKHPDADLSSLEDTIIVWSIHS